MGAITVVGAGWTKGQLTLEAAEALTSGARVMLHTGRCGCAEWLREHGVPFETLDGLYEACDDFDEHARAAAKAVRDAAAEGDVAYVVFDVRDRSAVALAAGGDVRVIAGPPAEGALLALVAGETRCVEASDWESFHLTARENCFVREIDGQALACEVKLKLMEVYPEESEIWLLRGEGAPEQIKLYEMDRASGLDHRVCALIPAQRDIMKLERYDYEHLIELIRFLVSPQGCPWDRVQTHESLRPNMLEEAYEVVDAIDEHSPEHLYDELGDMLLQIALHAEIGRKHGEFDSGDITTAICQKMIHRHTHVFGRDHADDAGEVLGLWTKNKMAERGQATRTAAMRDVNRSLPAMLRAVKVLKRASEAGVCRRDAEEAMADCAALLPGAGEDEARFGEMMMALCDLARRRGIDPELALNAATDRFIGKFEHLEDQIRSEGRVFETISPETLREYWYLVKL
ncbi:MAG: MazG family protein [Clostridia bacterium]|nr:MazG family protein [Clostridia bacterium]